MISFSAVCALFNFLLNSVSSRAFAGFRGLALSEHLYFTYCKKMVEIEIGNKSVCVYVLPGGCI